MMRLHRTAPGAAAPPLTGLALSAPLFAAFLVVGAGVGVADATALPVLVAGPLAATALAGAAAGLRRGRGTYVATLGAFAALGALAAAIDDPPAPVRQGCADPGELWRVRVDRVVGRVVDRHTGEIERPAILALEAERCGPRWEPRAGRVTARLRGHGPVARGDRLELRLAVEPLGLRRNPTDPDPRLLARRDRLAGRARVRSPYVLVEPGGGLLAWIDRARDATAARFDRHLDPTSAALARALSSGDQSAVTAETRDAWSASGLAHLLSVSGLHVTLLAGLVFVLARRGLALVPGFAERFSARRAGAVVALPAVVFFCLWAGAPVPAVRATVMGCAFLAGLASGRPSAILNACGLAGVAILLASPVSLYDPGFLLSFVAILFLLFLPPRAPAAGALGRLRRAAAGLMLASVVAAAATAPVTAHFFGRISLAAPLANLVGVPLGSAVATPLALGFALVAPLGELPAELAARPLALVLELLDGLARLWAAAPFAAVDVREPSLPQALLFYAGLVALVLGPRVRRGRLLGAGCLALVAALGVARELVPPDGELRIWYPYVGQGDAAVVRLPSGETALVDAGGSYDPDDFDPGRGTLAPLLRRSGVRTLDLAVVTHPHPDHLGGFAYVAGSFRIRELWWSGNGEDLPAMRDLLAAVRRGGGRVLTGVELPAVFERGGVRFEVLHPRPGPDAEGLPYFPELGANDNSLVLRLSLGGRSILLPGDIEADAETRVAPLLARTDVLKSPHHGSRTSSTPALLGPLAPRLVVISLGSHNRFGFPDAEVVRRYQAAGAAVVRTDRDGLVELATNGERWRITTASGRVIVVP